MRMPGMKYHTKQDFPRKCEACGAGTDVMRRHGYQVAYGNAFYWKKFMCMTCGKIMKRRSGYTPTPTTNPYQLEFLRQTLKDLKLRHLIYDRSRRSVPPLV